MKLKIKLMVAGFCTLKESIAIKGGRKKKRDFPATFALIEHPKEGYILFDTGYSERFFEVTRGFPECMYRWSTPVTIQKENSAAKQLEALGIQPKEIKYIILSHFHADHIGGVSDFPHAKIICFASEFRRLSSLNRYQSVVKGFLRELLPLDFNKRMIDVGGMPMVNLPHRLAPFTVGYDLFGDQSVLGINLPGHANEQLGIYFQGHEQDVFFIADAAWSHEVYRENRGPSLLGLIAIEDRKAYYDTLEKIHELYQRVPDLQIIASHALERGIEWD